MDRLEVDGSQEENTAWLSDNTKVAGNKWSVLREHAMQDNYKEQSWVSII